MPNTTLISSDITNWTRTHTKFELHKWVALRSVSMRLATQKQVFGRGSGAL